MFRFYFRYLYGRSGQYELYGDNTYEERIEPELADFVSETFESLCHLAVPTLYEEYQLTQGSEQWWYMGREIDIVAPTDGSTLIAGEAKFTTSPLGYDVLLDLEDDVEYIDWTPDGAGTPTYNTHCSAGLGSLDPSKMLQQNARTFACFPVPTSLGHLKETALHTRDGRSPLPEPVSKYSHVIRNHSLNNNACGNEWCHQCHLRLQ